MVCKHEKPLQQVVKRYHEQSIKVLNNNKNTKNISYEPQFEMPNKEGPTLRLETYNYLYYYIIIILILNLNISFQNVFIVSE